MTLRRTLVPSLTSLAIAAGFLIGATTPGLAQSVPPSQGPTTAPINVAIDSIEISVQDLRTKEELGSYAPGDTLVLAAGERVRLRLVAVPAGRQRSARYPSARFEVISGSRRVALSKVNEAQGSAVLEGVRSDDPRSRNSTTLVQYQILQEMNARRGLMKGTLTIEVGDGASAQGPQAAAYDPSSWTAEEMTDLLYQAILLRSMDRSGAAGFIQMIERDGYEGILEAASIIARSEESQASVYGREIAVDGRRRQVTHEDRVAALYHHLLDLEIEEMNSYDYASVLRRVQGGKIHDVVVALLRSPRFTDRFGVGSSSRQPVRRQRN